MWNYVVRRNRAPMESDPNRGRRFLRFDGELSVLRLAALANTQCTNSPHPPPGGLPRFGSLSTARTGLPASDAVALNSGAASPAFSAANATVLAIRASVQTVSYTHL